MRSKLLSVLAIAAVATASAAQAPAPTAGFRAEFLSNYAQVTDKFIQLANAIPADKYTWRPAPGVRSIAEVFLHVAAAQYLFGTSMGWPAPAGVDASKLETSTTDKAAVIAAMKAAFGWYKTGTTAMPDADAEKMGKFFGTPMTMRAFLFAETDHNAEHLGQMIAYARVNGIVPPWSMKQGGM
jgi:uncharacterized damage-inducible protein DinB